MRAVINTMRTLTPTQAVVGVVIWLMIIIGAGQAIMTSGHAPTPAPCTPQAHVMFNTCATLDTTQVQDRRPHTQAPVQAPPTAAPTDTEWVDDTASDWPTTDSGMAACTEEDASAPDQPFPCLWESAHGADLIFTGADQWVTVPRHSPEPAPESAPTAAPTAAPSDNGYGADSVAPEMPHCAQEDGSGAGQVFPCQWDGAVDGNGIGNSYVLTEAL
jgi:hypothetical protein